MNKPLILVTNDDGIDSKGIRLLVSIMSGFGEVVVVAPDSPQSGMGHAITVGDKLRLVKSDLFGDIQSYKCSGTPADCVKIAKHHILKNRNIDLIASGINHGSNSSISVLYSGTMSAAIEGAIENTPAIGFSLCDFDPNAYLDHSKEYIKIITKNAIENGMPESIALNVNIPAISSEKIKGIKLCRQANAIWEILTRQRTMHKYFPYQTFIWRTKKYGKNLVVVCTESRMILTILKLDDWDDA